MEFKQREELVRRILSGKLYGKMRFQHETYDIIFSDPTLDILAEADWIYKKSFNDMKNSNEYFTLEESYETLKENGSWTDKMEKEMKKLEEEILELKNRLNKLTFNIKEQKLAKKSIEIKKKKHADLYSTKNQLWRSSIEYISDKNKKRFIIQNCIKINDKEVLHVPAFIENLIVYIYEENNISEDSIRELARTNPWRLYWTASKTIGGSLFKHSISEITELQYIIVSWSKIYDFAYESSNRPSDEIINDSDKFDSWYKEECDKIDIEVKKNSIDSKLNGVAGQEVFIPADSEGAKEIYRLNDPNNSTKISERYKAINEKGSVLECDLPDVKRELQLEANKLTNIRR